MKIIFITAYSHRQGTYFRWHNLAIGLRKLGHDISVFTFDATIGKGSSTEIRDGIPYHILYSSRGQKWFGRLAHPMNVLRALFNPLPKADIYHIFQPFPISCVRGLWYKNRAKRIFYDWDDYWYGGLVTPEALKFSTFEQRYTHFWTRLFENNMPKWSDYTTVCSSFLWNKAQAIDKRNGRLRMIYNGFWPIVNQIEKIDARKRLNIPIDGIYFGFMGRTIEEIDWCFDVLRISTEGNIKLAICGMDKKQLPKISESENDRLIFLGQLTPEETKIFVNAIDVGLLPMENTTFNQSRFPIKFSEYLAANIPVICSEVGEVFEISKKLKGVYLAGKDRDNWKKVTSMVIDNSLCGTLKSPDLMEVEAELSWSSISKKIEKIYLDL